MITTEHAVTKACFGVHCWSHDVDEDPDGGYLRCFECGHVYRTPDELVAEYNYSAESLNRLHPQAPPALGITSPDEAGFCPLCLHDF